MSKRNGVTVRGSTNRSEPSRGDRNQRRKRKQYLLDKFGDGTTAPCSYCRADLTIETITTDRHPIPGCQGGTYALDNIRPACGPCNSKHGGSIRRNGKEAV
jgi:5-methylcytosine-specific restriction endonuclease McrA